MCVYECTCVHKCVNATVCICGYDSVYVSVCAYIFIPLSFDLQLPKFHVNKLCYAWRIMSQLTHKNVPLCR